ncbi:MAG: Hpt domain-containing protein [Agarilytica sp.]
MSDDVDLENLNMLKDLLGDKFIELIETFISDSAQRIDAIQRALASGDIEQIRHQTHGLKGSCRNLGANPLGDLCQVMETQAHEGQLTDGEQQLAAIEQKLAAVNGALKSLL